jgi:ABC-2 type transport system ATP-binding protein
VKDEVAVDLSGVRAGYGRREVLSGVDLVVPRGEVVVLLGANGEGKTTVLRLCLGVLPVRAGTVRVLGLRPVKDAARLRRRIGFVPATPDAYGWMTACDLLRFVAPHLPTFDRRRADALIERLRVPTATPFRAMSRGEGMKAMLVAALAHDPELLLLDEPFAGLDPLVRDEVLGAVLAAVGEKARSVLVVTHDLDVAARVADRIAVLSGGRIVREGPASDFARARDEAPTPAALREALATAAQEA